MNIIGSSEELAERTAEIFQQTAARALVKAAEFDANRSAFSWLNGFAANAVKQLRSRLLNRREKFEDGLEDLERIEKLRRKIETTALPEETFWEKSERDETEKIRFEQLISKLNDDYRKILRLHYFEESDIIEIAARLGKTEGAAQRQLNRAETKLREMLGAEREKK
ncbi:MAG: sigma-70 family RNA polymerase sigma factor [Pyrinomonadaceae bacterium]|nr:sigma-70 family RNA polymerase sigma factor [Pyrinomonadaceae bacterium]